METIDRQRICSLAGEREAFICDLLPNCRYSIFFITGVRQICFPGFRTKKNYIGKRKWQWRRCFDFCDLRLRLTSDKKGLFQMRYLFRSGLFVCMGSLLSDLSPGNYLPNVTVATSRCFFPSCWQIVWRAMAQNCALPVSSQPFGENSCWVVRWL